MRYSAIKAICSVENLIHARLTNLNGPLQESDLIQILYSLLEALNDDDSEIRDLAASTVSHISWNGDGEFPPLVTSVKSQRLLFQYIKTLCIDQPDSLAYALARVLGLPKFASAPTGTPKVSLITPGEWIVMRPEPSLYLSLFEELGPTARSVEDALVDDDVLFGEERQNLYKDNVQEMEEWTGFLMTCQPPEQDWSRIYAWAFHGLEAIGKADGSSAWWSYQQEGFEAVCRVLMLARVAQSWSSDIDYLKILKDAVLKAELQLGLVHQEHAKIINILKSHFEDIE